jgi:hypothetical protein
MSNPSQSVSSSTLYKCNNYTCQIDNTGSPGSFSSLEDCNASCAPSFVCDRPQKGMPSCNQAQNLGNQLKSAQNQLKTAQNSLNEATQIQQQSQQSGLLTAAQLAKNNITEYSSQVKFFSDAVRSLDGQIKSGGANQYFNTLSTCQSSCKPRFSCDEDTLHVIPTADGSYNSIKEAENNCKARYTCDDNNWIIRMDPRGEFRTPTEASLHCKPPILVPNQSVTQDDVDQEVMIQNNIEGQFKSDTLRLESTYMHMFVWGAVMILVVYMVFYYSSNNTNTALQSLIAIFIAIVLIWIIAAWLWNYFSRHPIRFFSGPVLY